MPPVSILIAVYNGERYLREALESVRTQHYQDWECILVDDASKDQSAAIIREYCNQDRRFQFIAHTQNRGVAAARNSALEQARGHYALVLDQDDLLELSGLQELVAVAHRFSNAPAVAGTWSVLSPQTRVPPAQESGIRRHTFFDFALQNRAMALATLFRIDMARLVGGFQAGFEGCDEWDLWGKLSRSGGDLVFCGAHVSCYRLHDSNTSFRLRTQLEQGLKVLQVYHSADPRVPNAAPEYRDGAGIESYHRSRVLYLWYVLSLAYYRNDRGAIEVLLHTFRECVPNVVLDGQDLAALTTYTNYAAACSGTPPELSVLSFWPLVDYTLSQMSEQRLLAPQMELGLARETVLDACRSQVSLELASLRRRVTSYRLSRSFRLGSALTSIGRRLLGRSKTASD